MASVNYLYLDSCTDPKRRDWDRRKSHGKETYQAATSPKESSRMTRGRMILPAGSLYQRGVFDVVIFLL